MAKNMSVATAIEKNRLASDVAFIMALDVEVIDPVTGTFVETLRFCRNSENVIYGGNTYVASSFDVSISEATGEMPEISLTAIDFTGAIQARMQSYGGGIGFNVTIMVLNSAELTEECELKERYKVVGASAKNHAITFVLGNRNPLSIRFPRRVQMRDRCSWKYKGPECGYTGSLPNCDLSLDGSNGCKVHGIVENFGGFPAINPGNSSRRG